VQGFAIVMSVVTSCSYAAVKSMKPVSPTGKTGLKKQEKLKISRHFKQKDRSLGMSTRGGTHASTSAAPGTDHLLGSNRY
jgi:hypothetical protein